MDSEIAVVVFPGQGAQRAGMGQDFFAELPASRRVYEEAADHLGWDVAAVCFSDDGRLDLTEYTQPCILATEIAMLRGIADRYGFAPTRFGGHSLGEWTALVAAGALPLGAALRIVRERGRLMQSAVPPGVGAMTAVIADGLEPAAIAGHLVGLAVDVANINSIRQIVLSGEREAVGEAERRLAAVPEGASARFVRLNVSAPFHSRLMEPILAPFSEVLDRLAGDLDPAAATKVTSNYRGDFHSGNRAAVQEALVQQISHTVQWRQNMACLAATAGVVREIGPGRPLKDFFRTVGVACESVTTLAAAERLFA
jgi:[acyl-carrier-protein] S-malonyltransferase/trans-AT polyketide synthase/acyltransferase/oxidoreductase domain-containing protein